MRSSIRRRSLLSIPFYAALVFTAHTTAQKCYAPNGTAVEFSSVSVGSRLYVCPTGSDGFATCCAEGDFCHPDGLCYNLNGGQPTVRRQYCSDPTWGTSNCSPLCRHDADVNSPSNGGAVLTPCSDGKFCCGAFQYDCCDDHRGQYAIQGYEVGPGISYVSGSTTTKEVAVGTTSTSSTAAPSATADANTGSTTLSSTNNGPTGISGGTIAGIVVGGSVGVGMVCIAAALFFRKRRPSSPQSTHSSEKPWNAYYSGQNDGQSPHAGFLHPEATPASLPGELPVAQTRHELS